MSLLQSNGYVIAEYDIGQGVERLVQAIRYFGDGGFHTVYFRRHNEKAELRVDDYAPIRASGDSANIQMFTGVSVVKVGGNFDQEGNIVDYFNGIIGGKAVVQCMYMQMYISCFKTLISF